MSQSVFVAGDTGYMGRGLIPLLMQRGHEVRTLVRLRSERMPASGIRVIDVIDMCNLPVFSR